MGGLFKRFFKNKFVKVSSMVVCAFLILFIGMLWGVSSQNADQEMKKEQLQKDIAALQIKKGDVKHGLANQIEKNKEAIKKETAGLIQKHNDAKQEYEDQKSTTQDMTKQAKQAKKKLDDIKDKLADAQKEFEEQNKGLVSKRDEVKKELSKNKKDLKKVKGDLKDATNRLADINSKLNDSKNKYADIKQKLSSKQGELQSIEGKIVTASGKLQEAKKAPKILGAGEYLVGKDIPAGRYKATPNKNNVDFNFIVYSDGDNTVVNTALGPDYIPSYTFVAGKGYLIKTDGPVKLKPMK